ncbi:outer membrane protein [Palleronia sp.]|uniref:outer membrane protein n=1 Tax=Palleronia sp. TaxID=1940284 RepID=UPI0035C819A6
MKTTIMISAAAMMAAGVAHAGGVAPTVSEPQPQMRPVLVAEPDWTGPYAGVALGYGDVDAEVFEPLDIDAGGALGGGFAGYQYDFGDFVLGAELDGNIANMDVDLDDVSDLASDFGEDDLADAIDDIEIGVDALHRVKLRAGYDAGRALVYGVAGAAYANLNVEADFADVDEDYDDWGYVIGAGSEVRVTDSVTLGAEVLYHKFDDLIDADTLGADDGLEAEIVTVQARLAYRF